MKSTKIYATLGAAALLLAIASPAQAAEKEKYNGYTKAKFVAAAQEVGGLSAAKAKEAWADPELRESTIVRATESVTESPAIPATQAMKNRIATESGEMSVAAATMQKTFSVKRTYYSLLGLACIDWTVKKTFLYNQVRVWHDIVSTTPAPACGYSYNGIVENSDSYGAISGITNSRSVSVRAGQFGMFDGTKYTIKITAEGRYNGVTNSSSSIVQ